MATQIAEGSLKHETIQALVVRNKKAEPLGPCFELNQNLLRLLLKESGVFL
jgi:hypothetical protein